MGSAFAEDPTPTSSDLSSNSGSDSRPRVLHLIKGLTVVGGAERLVLSLTAAGDRTRFDYRVAHVLSRPSDHLLSEFGALGVPVYGLDVSSHYDLSWILRLRKLIVDHRIDVLHLHLPYTAIFGRLGAHSMRNDRPMIVYTQHTPWNRMHILTRVLNGATYRLDDADIAVSAPTWTSLPRRLRTKTEVLVHGVAMDRLPDPVEARMAVRSEFGIGPEEVLIVTVANMRKEKAYDVLLGSARLLVDDGLPVRFLAVGHGPLEEQVRRLRDELGLSERFLLTGFRSDAQRIVAASDVFVLASHYEAFPISVMEALAAGVPVVSTAVGDLPRVVGEAGAGMIVPTGDAEALATGLRTLVASPEDRERMAEAARTVGSTMDINLAAQRLQQIYLSLMSAERSDPAASDESRKRSKCGRPD
jgi:glycosyltransferase involved in cell wall biosynthesis